MIMSTPFPGYRFRRSAGTRIGLNFWEYGDTPRPPTERRNELSCLSRLVRMTCSVHATKLSYLWVERRVLWPMLRCSNPSLKRGYLHQQASSSLTSSLALGLSLTRASCVLKGLRPQGRPLREPVTARSMEFFLWLSQGCRARRPSPSFRERLRGTTAITARVAVQKGAHGCFRAQLLSRR